MKAGNKGRSADGAENALRQREKGMMERVINLMVICFKHRDVPNERQLELELREMAC